MISIVSITLVYSYYSFYPTSFQINGKFSVRGIDIGKSFESSKIVAPNFLFRTFQEDDKFNMTIEATRGWEAKKLTIYNASIRKYPIIYDTILFQTNGSVSLEISNPRFLFISPQNLSVSIFTGKVDSAFFIAEAGGSLLMENVTSAYVSFSKGNPVIDFQVVGGNISVPDSIPSFNLSNKDDIIGMRVEMEILVEAEMVGTGKFGIESNTFSSLTLDCWSSPLTAYFGFPNGFLSYANTIQQLSGSQNLNLTRFKGEITLLNPQAPHEITIQGYADKIFVGITELTAPNFYRDLVQTVSPFSNLLTVIASITISTSITLYMTRKKERKESRKVHLKEFKDKLFAPLIENLEKHFYPSVKFRLLDDYVFLSGLVSHEEYPLDVGRLEAKVNRRLLMDLPNHFQDLNSKLQRLKEMLNKYNESYLALAKKCDGVITEIELGIRFKHHGIFAGLHMPTALWSRKGGSAEWAFMLLLGAREEDLENILQLNEKSEGIEIFEELKKEATIFTLASEFKQHCTELEKLLDEIMKDLQNLLKSTTINGTCDLME
jgi:hypothetical protein